MATKGSKYLIQPSLDLLDGSQAYTPGPSPRGSRPGLAPRHTFSLLGGRMWACLLQVPSPAPHWLAWLSARSG